jgi:4'-phosphopantetheinyl transferase EntD
LSALDAIIERWLIDTLGVKLHVSVSSTMCDRDKLTKLEQAKFAELASTPRAKSWLTGRSALKKVLSKLGRSLDTGAITFPNPEISLSHSGDFAIAILTEDFNVKGVGVDIELIRTVRPATARFFLTKKEQDFVESVPASSRGDELLRLWTVKESLFKADINNERKGLTHYSLQDPSQTTGYGRMRGAGNFSYKYTSIRLETAMVSGAVNTVTR